MLKFRLADVDGDLRVAPEYIAAATALHAEPSIATIHVTATGKTWRVQATLEEVAAMLAQARAESEAAA